MTPRRKGAGEVSRIVGQHIAYWRRWRGLTGTTLAHSMSALGFPMYHSTVSAIENGHDGISVDRLVAFAKVLQVTPQQLLEGPACRSCWDTPPPKLTCQVCGAAG